MNILDKLKTILDSDFQIQYNLNKIVYHKFPHYIHHNQKRQKIHCLKTFTFSHFQSVPSNLQPVLNTIKYSFQDRFEDQESKNQIEDLFKQLVINDKTQGNSLLNEFKNNLSLILNNYPRYKFNNNLEVFDTNRAKPSTNWDERKVFEEFTKKSDFYLASISESKEKEELVVLINAVKQLILPVKTVKIGMFIETTPYSVDMSNDASYKALLRTAINDCLIEGIPFLTNLEFFHTHQNKIDLKEWNKYGELYVASDNPICLVIPKDKNPEEFGFKNGLFKKWKSTIASLPHDKFNLDITSLMVNETSSERFVRFFLLVGHGKYEINSQEGIVLGLPTSFTHAFLTYLDKVNSAGAFICSCYIGHNAENLFFRLPLSYPVFLSNSHSYYCTVESGIYHDFLNAIEREYLNNRMIKTVEKWQPTRAVCESVIKAIGASHSHNQVSYVLPANNPDIPRVAYATTQYSSKALDLEAFIKKGRTFPIKEPIEINGNEWRSCFLSRHLYPKIKLTGEKKCTFSSRGQKSWHILKGLDLGEITGGIHEQVHSLFNFEIGYAPKAYLINRIDYVKNGEQKTLHQVMVYTASKKEIYLYFRDSENNFYKVEFINDPISGLTEQVEKVTFLTAITAIYQKLIDTVPSKIHLRYTEFDQFSLDDILDDIKSYFWKNSSSDDIDLFHLIFLKRILFPFNGNKACEIGKQIGEAIKSKKMEENARKKLAHDCIDFAQNMNSNYLSYIIRNCFSNEFILAVLDNNLDKIKELLNKDPQLINSQDINGNNAINLVFDPDISKKVAHYLIDAGIDVTNSNRFGSTCLKDAFEFYSTPALAEKIMAKWNVKELDEKTQDDLWYKASKLTNNGFVDILLKYKVGEISKIPILYYIAINCIEKAQRAAIIAKILEAYPGEDVNKPCPYTLNTSLHAVSERSDMKSIKLLLEMGVNVNALNKLKLTPLQHTIKANNIHYDCAKLLIEKGTLLNNKSIDGKTVLHYLLESAELTLQKKSNNLQLFTLFLNNGADYNIPDNEGITVKKLAAEKPEFLQLLIDFDKNAIDLPDEAGLSLLGNAIMTNNLEMAEKLIALGASIKNCSSTLPIFLRYFKEKSADIGKANYCVDEKMVKFMLERDVDINAKDAEGNNSIYYASMSQPVSLISMLVDNGADWKSVNIHKGFAFHISLVYDNFEVFEYFLNQPFDFKEDHFLVLMKILILKNKFKNSRYLLRIIFNRANNKCYDRHQPYFSIYDQETEELTKFFKTVKNWEDIYLFGDHILYYAICLGEDKAYDQFKIIFDNLTGEQKKDALNYVDSFLQRTLLHYAVTFGQEKIAEELIRHGADIEKKDWRGKKPSDYKSQA